MNNSYVFRVLHTFSSEETEAFRLFLDSPYFNRGALSEKHKMLFQVFEKSGQQSDPNTLSKQFVYELLFPEGPVVDGKLDKLVTEFKKLLHTFLLTHRYLQDENTGEHLLGLAVELRERGLEDKYKPAFARAQKMAYASEQESIDNYRLRFQVEKEKHEWNSLYNTLKGDMNLPEVIFGFDKYYFAYRLHLTNYLSLIQKVTKVPLSVKKPPYELSQLPKPYLEAGSLTHISWEIHTILKSQAPMTADFERIRDMLQVHEPRISPVHLKDYHTYVRNLCAILIDLNNSAEFRQMLFQIQVDHLGRGYFYYDGKIPSNAMLGITTTALSVQAITWVNDFVEQHKNRIMDETETQDVYRLNKALCLFAEKQYDQAMEIIPLSASATFFHLFAHRLELKIYFEQDDELLSYKIDAFRMLISRTGKKRLSQQVYEQHLNFVNFLRQLSLLPKAKDPSKAERLTQRINAKKMVADRAWLLEKVRALGT